MVMSEGDPFYFASLPMSVSWVVKDNDELKLTHMDSIYMVPSCRWIGEGTLP